MASSKSHKLLIVALFAVGLVLFAYGVRDMAKAWRCSSWPVVKGRVMDAGLSEIDKGIGGVDVRFAPDIKYEYKFKGMMKFSNTIGYFPPSALGLSDSYYAGNEDQALRFISRYPVDSTVSVYVNPDNPSESVLDPRVKLPVLIPLILGALCMYAAFHTWVFRRCSPSTEGISREPANIKGAA